MAEERVRVLVVDDHELVGYALQRALSEIGGMEVIGPTADPQRAVALAASTGVEVVVLDRRLSNGFDTIDLLPEFAARAPEARILLLSGSFDDHALRRALSAGCAGCVLKTQPVDQLVSAVRCVARGEMAIAPELMTRFVKLTTSPSVPDETLSAREIEVLQLLAYGRSTAQISTELYISENTARNHIRHIIQKLGVHSRLEAAATGIRRGLVTAP